MLLNDFYKLVDVLLNVDDLTGKVIFNAEHEIFKGHFPDQPVVPGVCMIQMIKEILEQNLGMKLQLSQGNQIKFLKLIDPKVTPELSVFINWQNTENQIITSATFKDQDANVLKFQGVFQLQGNIES